MNPTPPESTFNTSIDPPPAIGGQPSTPFTQSSFVCKACQKEVPCLALDFSQCQRVPASSWLWEGASGYTCGECKAALCHECWQKHQVQFSLWRRWKNTVCSECQRPFRPGLVFVPVEKASLLRETLEALGKPPFRSLQSFVRWTARILSLLPILGMLTVIVPVLTGNTAGTRDIVLSFSFLFLMLMAWRWELLGGGLLLGVNTADAYINKMKEEPWGTFLFWMLAFLFLLSGSLKIATNSAASRKAVLAAKILALLFALLACLSLYGCYRVRGTFNG